MSGVSWRSALARPYRAAFQRAVHWAWRAAGKAGSITPGSPAAGAFAAFGPGSVITFPTGAIFGQPWIAVGADTLVGTHVTLSAGTVPGQDLGGGPVLRIGDRCVLGRGSHVVAHHSIVIGDDVYTGPYVYITDQNHGYSDPDVPVGRQWPTNTATSIGDGTWLGAGAIVLPGSRIGRNVVVAAGSVVRGDIPHRCVVAGVPAKVVREYLPGTGWSPALRAPDRGVPHGGTAGGKYPGTDRLASAGPAEPGMPERAEPGMPEGTEAGMPERAEAGGAALADPQRVERVTEPPDPVL